MTDEGWYIDPTGRHGLRWFSAGRPTALVRDGHHESQDVLDPDEAERAAHADARSAPMTAASSTSLHGRPRRTVIATFTVIVVAAMLVVAFVVPSESSSDQRDTEHALASYDPTPAACQLVPVGDLRPLLGDPTVTPGQSLSSPTCVWASKTADSTVADTTAADTTAVARGGRTFSLTMSVVGPGQPGPTPPPGVSSVDLGLRAWTASSCLPAGCRQELDVELTASNLVLVVASSSSDRTTWQAGAGFRQTQLEALAGVAGQQIVRQCHILPAQGYC